LHDHHAETLRPLELRRFKHVAMLDPWPQRLPRVAARLFERTQDRVERRIADRVDHRLFPLRERKLQE